VQIQYVKSLVFLFVSSFESERAYVDLHEQVSGTSESSATSPEHHAIFPIAGGKRIHPVAYSDVGSPGEMMNAVQTFYV
jgi:hypothetical protein